MLSLFVVLTAFRVDSSSLSVDHVRYIIITLFLSSSQLYDCCLTVCQWKQREEGLLCKRTNREDWKSLDRRSFNKSDLLSRRWANQLSSLGETWFLDIKTKVLTNLGTKNEGISWQHVKCTEQECRTRCLQMQPSRHLLISFSFIEKSNVKKHTVWCLDANTIKETTQLEKESKRSLLFDKHRLCECFTLSWQVVLFRLHFNHDVGCRSVTFN